MEEWTYVDECELSNCRCSSVCVACQHFRHGVDQHCARWWGSTFARSNCNRANTSSRPTRCGLQRGKAQWAGPRRWADCGYESRVMPCVFIPQGGATGLMVEANSVFSMTKFTIPWLKVFCRAVFDLVLLNGVTARIGFVIRR